MIYLKFLPWQNLFLIVLSCVFVHHKLELTFLLAPLKLSFPPVFALDGDVVLAPVFAHHLSGDFLESLDDWYANIFALLANLGAQNNINTVLVQAETLKTIEVFSILFEHSLHTTTCLQILQYGLYTTWHKGTAKLFIRLQAKYKIVGYAARVR